VGAAREEYFLAGTEQAMIVTKTASAAAPRIAYPRDGEIIALDPDIPAGAQRVRFAAEPEINRARWRIEPEAQETLTNPSWWTPQSGKFVLSLLNESGETLDRVAFEVRGRIGQ
jgi:penicillin-binding protein 1C